MKRSHRTQNQRNKSDNSCNCSKENRSATAGNAFQNNIFVTFFCNFNALSFCFVKSNIVMRHDVNSVRGTTGNQCNRNYARNNRECKSKNSHKSTSAGSCKQNRNERQKSSVQSFQAGKQSQKNDNRNKRNQVRQIRSHVIHKVFRNNWITKENNLKICAFCIFEGNLFYFSECFGFKVRFRYLSFCSFVYSFCKKSKFFFRQTFNRRKFAGLLSLFKLLKSLNSGICKSINLRSRQRTQICNFARVIVCNKRNLHLSRFIVVRNNRTRIHFVPVSKILLKLIYLSLSQKRKVSVFVALCIDNISSSKGTVNILNKVNFCKGINSINPRKVFYIRRNMVDNLQIFRSNNCSLVSFKRNSDYNSASKPIFRINQTLIRLMFLRKIQSGRVVHLNIFKLECKQTCNKKSCYNNKPWMLK